ncbi:FtsX-like permease family protein [Paenibacillus sp. CAU 1782]
MTFRQFAFRNVFRNKRLYAAYFLSSMFSVIVFFTFSIFAYHPDIDPTSSDNTAGGPLSVAKWIIYVFSFFFVLYSMSAFLKSRSNEFGLLILHGMSPLQQRRMIFLENIIIGFSATIGGIVLGTAFAKGILLLGENVLQLDGKLDFYFPFKSIWLTLLSYSILFIVISFFTSVVLRQKELIDLIKGTKRQRQEPASSIWLSLMAAVMMAVGYWLALNPQGLQTLALLPLIAPLVIIATYFLFTQLSVKIIQSLKKEKLFFWRGRNMILLSDLSYRMKDNARTFFLVAVVSTVSFSAIGALYTAKSMLSDGFKGAQHYVVDYSSKAGNELEQEHVAKIQQELDKQSIDSHLMDIPLNYYTVEGAESPVAIINLNTYNAFAEAMHEPPLQLADNEVVLVNYGLMTAHRNQELLNMRPLMPDGASTPIVSPLESMALPRERGYLVASDELYAGFRNPVAVSHYYMWHTPSPQKGAIKAGESLAGQFPKYSNFHSYSAPAYEERTMNATYAPLLFIGLFVGIVFFVSAGSFLYYRLYSDLDDDKAKFKAIAKLGLGEKELSSILTRQLAILFFAPILVALIHGAVALTSLSKMMEYSIFYESVTVLGIFLAVQVIYYLVVRHLYIKQIMSAL